MSQVQMAMATKCITTTRTENTRDGRAGKRRITTLYCFSAPWFQVAILAAPQISTPCADFPTWVSHKKLLWGLYCVAFAPSYLCSHARVHTYSTLPLSLSTIPVVSHIFICRQSKFFLSAGFLDTLSLSTLQIMTSYTYLTNPLSQSTCRSVFICY